ncbi:hypothetical protein HQ590_12005, partial [bacterium]|nr:hypothetical protein [bacterium]
MNPSDELVTPAPAAAEALEAVQRMVRKNIRRWRRLVLLQSVGLVVAIPLAYFWLALVLDSRVHLSRAGRLALALGFIAVVVGLLWSQRRRWQQLRLSEDEVALAIESRTPGGIQNRLINAVQLARENGTTGEVGAVVIRRNYEELRQMPLPAAARSGAAWGCVGLALLAVVTGGVLQQLAPEGFGNSTRRLLLPLAEIAPVYRTWLEIEPGHTRAAGDVTIRVRVHGERPARLTVLRVRDDIRTSDSVAVSRGGDEVLYTFRNLRENLSYAVRANDFVSPWYQITVNTAAELTRVRARLVYPEYTRLPPRDLESTAGDLEALLDTQAEAVFVLDRPVVEASLLLEGTGVVTATVTRVALTPRGAGQANGPATEFAGTLTFRDVQGYRLETKVPTGTPQAGKLRGLRVLADAEPKPELIGLERETEVAPEAQVALKLTAHDDIGLAQVGLFLRRVDAGPSTPAQPNGNGSHGGTNGWTAVKVWPVEGRTQFSQEFPFSVAAQGAAEGERFELQARAADTDPLKQGSWVTGPTHLLIV